MLGHSPISSAPISSSPGPSGTYNFRTLSDTVSATGTLNALKARIQKLFVTSATDEFRQYLVLGLHMDGTNGGTSFTDITGKSVTSTSNLVTTDTTYKQFGTASSYHNGTTALGLQTPANSAFLFTGDFTIEGWVRFNSVSGGPNSMFGIWDGVNYFYLAWWSNPAAWVLPLNNQSNTSMGGGTPTVGQWYHVALVRAGTGTNNIKLYIDGTVTGVYQTNTSTLGWDNQTFCIGSSSTGGSNRMNGWIDELAVYNGVAKYTSNFTRPAAPFYTGGVISSPVVLPGRTYPKIVTADNNPVVVGMHFEGANNGTTFTEVTGKTVTLSGSPVTSTAQYKVGTSSLSLDGASYLSLAASSDYVMSGDFTLELWVRYTTLGTFLCGQIWFSSGWHYIGVQYYGTNWEFYADSVGLFTFPASAPATNTWYHIAVVRSGTGTGNLSLFVNGVKNGTSNTAVGTFGNAAEPFTIGGAAIGTPISGYIDSLRVLNGRAAYSVDFIPPDAPFKYGSGLPVIGSYSKLNGRAKLISDAVAATATLISGWVRYRAVSAIATAIATGVRRVNKQVRIPQYVVLGFHMDGVDNGTSFPEVTGRTVTRGTVVTKTAVKQFGTASMYIAGVGQLQVPASTDFLFPGDFTIEAWVRFSTNTGGNSTRSIVGCYSSGTSSYFLFAWDRANARFGLWTNTGSNSSLGAFTPTVDTWYHVAVVRSGTGAGNIKLYIDGTPTGTTITSTATLGYSTSIMYVGYGGTGSTNFDGYIDDIVVYKGYAKYTSAFSVPTEQFGMYSGVYGGTLSATILNPRWYSKIVSAIATLVGTIVTDYIPAAGNTTYKTITAVVTATAVGTRQVGKLLVDSVPVVRTLTATKSFYRTVTDAAAITATITSAKSKLYTLTATAINTVESVSKQAGKALTDAAANMATLDKVKTATRALTDIVAVSATLSATKSFFRTLTDIVTSVVTTLRTSSKAVSDTVPSAATLLRGMAFTYTASVSAAATLVRSALRVLVDTVSLIATLDAEKIVNSFMQAVTATVVVGGTVAKQVGKLATLTVGSVASVAKSMPRTVAATLTFVATLAMQSFIYKALTAAAGSVGSTAVSVYKAVSGSAATTATVQRLSAMFTTLTAAIALVPSLARAVVATVQDTVTTIATVVPTFSITRTLSAASATIASTAKEVIKLVSGTTVFTATLEAMRVALRTVTATMTHVATLIPTFVITRSLTATVATVASAIKDIYTTATATGAAVATAAKEVAKAVNVQMIVVATLAAELVADIFDQVITATATTVSDLSKQVGKIAASSVAATASVARDITTAVSTATSAVVASVATFFGVTANLIATSAITATLEAAATKLVDLLATVASVTYLDRLLVKTLATVSPVLPAVNKGLTKTYTATVALIGGLKFGIARIAGFIMSRSIFVGRDETTAEEPIVASKVVSVEPDQTVVFVDPDDDAVSKTQNRNVAK